MRNSIAANILSEDLSPSKTTGIPPHGGKLVNRVLDGDARQTALARAKTLRHIPISPVTAADIEMIAIGAYSPLTGFMKQVDYECVLNEMRLDNRLVWPIPITLPIFDNSLTHQVNIGEEVALVQDDCVIALMTVSESYKYDKTLEAIKVYGTTKVKEHPGVLRLCVYQGNTLLAGDIWLVNRPRPRLFPHLRLTPADTRQIFTERNWKTVAGFQTRNPPHRAHEYIQKLALQITDGLFIQPLIGTTRREEIPVDLRIKSYQVVIHHYYPQDRVLLGLFPAAMCFAGPREAVFHALCRKNYGCTHFIVGRNHAGVGGFYARDAAAKIFEQFGPEEIGIQILSYVPHLCHKCDEMTTTKTCPHEEASYDISSSEIRAMLRRGEMPPPEIMRPEVSQMLIDGWRMCR